jgi:chondroitin AC lyase
MTNMVGEMLEATSDVLPVVPYYLQRLRSDGGFSDLNYRGNSDASAADLQQVGVRLEALSLAYKWNDPSNTWFNNQQLKSQVLKGWSYLASKGGYVNAPNWWWKAIGVPQGLADGLVTMRAEMSSNVRGQILNKYFGTVWQPTNLDGANLAYQAPMAMIDGLLRGNTSRIRDVVSKVSTELYRYSGEGINRDLSFYQHKAGGKPEYYSGSYGLVFARDTSRVMNWAGGTPYAFASWAVDQEVHYILDGLAWLTRGDALDIPSQGRSISRPGWPTNAPFILRNAMADLAPLGRRTPELLAAVDRYDNGVSDTNYLSGNKSFWMSDAMANQRPEMLTTVRMLSNRVARPETAAGDNRLGFFEGDGFTMFVQDGDEFGHRGGPEIMGAWDWQRLPGTTVEHTCSIPYYDMFNNATNSAGGSDVVGSVSDGQYGLAAMDYRRSGVSVTAKKSWFFFDNEVVALGAGINDSSPSAPVFTSLNQVFQDGPVTVQDAAGRRTFDLGGSAILNGQGWIEHDGLGYVLLDSTDQTTVQAQLQRGMSGLALPVFSAWVNHGVGPTNATYAYAVVPGVTPDELDSYSQALPINILANTSAVQAVKHVGLQQTQVAFYAAGSLRISDDLAISVDRPINLIIKQSGDDLTITAAEPRQASTAVTIYVNRQLSGPGVTLLTDGVNSQITFALPSLRGSSATQTYHALIPSPIAAEGEFALLVSSPLVAPPQPTSFTLGSLLASHSSSTVGSQSTSSTSVAKATVGSFTSTTSTRLTQGHAGPLASAFSDPLALDAAFAVWDDFSSIAQ